MRPKAYNYYYRSDHATPARHYVPMYRHHTTLNRHSAHTLSTHTFYQRTFYSYPRINARMLTVGILYVEVYVIWSH